MVATAGPSVSGMRLVGVAVREVVVLEVVGDLGCGGAEAERNIGRGDALGGDEDVGLHVPVIDGEPLAGAAPAGHHFVGDQQHAVAIADFAQAREVLGRRNEDAVGADDRLDDDGGHIALVADHVLDVVGAGDVAGGIGVLDGAVVAVGLRRKDDAGAFAARLHGPAARIAGGRDGARGRAVIGAVARDDLGLAGVHAGDFEGRFVGLGAAGGEEEFVQSLGQHFEQLRAEAGAGRGGVAGRDIGKLARLLGDGLDDARILVAEVDAHQLRAEIEIALARAVSEPAAFGIGNVQRLPAFLEAPGAVVGLPRDGW